MNFKFNIEQRGILRLALPAIAGLSAQMVVSLVDTAMVGRLPNATLALAAMGIGVLATWAIVSFFSSMATGTHVLISRAFGNKNYKRCSEILSTAIIISIAAGVSVLLLFILFAHDISQFFAADPKVGELAGDYLYFRFLGIPFFLISVSYRGFFFGIRKTKIFMYSGIITNLLNILFNYIFIYGGFGIKAMGLAGAGLGSSLATVADGIFYLLITNRRYYKSKFDILSNFTFDKEIVKNIMKISIPVSFQNVFILIGFLSFIAITGLIGVKEQAASQTVVSALFISLMPCFGFGIAVQTLVGNALGEGDNRKAKHLGNETVKLAIMYTAAVAVLFIFFPSAVILIFTTDRGLIATAAPLLQIAGGGQILYAAGVVLANGLQSAGKSLFVMLVDILVNWAVFIPLAYLLAIPFGLGINGAWFAVPIYVFLYSASITLKFNFGSWFKEKY